MLLSPDCDLQDLRESPEELKDQAEDTSSKDPPSKSVRNSPLQEYLLPFLMIIQTSIYHKQLPKCGCWLRLWYFTSKLSLPRMLSAPTQIVSFILWKNPFTGYNVCNDVFVLSSLELLSLSFNSRVQQTPHLRSQPPLSLKTTMRRRYPWILESLPSTSPLKVSIPPYVFPPSIPVMCACYFRPLVSIKISVKWELSTMKKYK